MPIPLSARNIGALAQLSIGPIALYEFTAFNSSTQDAYVQLFNKTLANVSLGTTVPDKQVKVGAGGTVTLNLPVQGVQFTNGIVMASTTADTGNVASPAGVSLYVSL